MHMRYWCIDGKYRMYEARLRNEGKTKFSDSFQPFHAEQYCIYPEIKFAKKYCIYPAIKFAKK